MTLITTAWLMGSEPDVPATTISVTCNAVTEDLAIPAGDYYLWDSTAANSALDMLSDVLETHSEIGIGDISPVLGRDRIPRFTGPLAFSIDSWSDLTFRDILGFTGTEAFASTTQAAAGFSRYLWSPGRCEIPDAPLGSQGLPYKDTAKGMSGDGVVVATTNNTGRKNRFQFRLVQSARVMTSAESNGEYVAFWDAVVSRYFRWKLYREVTEEDTAVDTTSANLLGEVLGPYKLLQRDGLDEFAYSRSLSRVELFSPVEIPCLLVSEY